MAQIFISYKRTDRDKVFPLVKSIENELGCKCWVDLDGIESSMQFASVICRAIDNAEVVLFMHSAVHLSIDYENDWTVKELNYAQQKSKRVVLVRLDGAPLDNIFLMNYGSKNNIDSRDPLQFEKLLNDLRSWLQLPQHKSTMQPEVMCPCGSGKLFKDCHGKHAVVPESYASKPTGPVSDQTKASPAAYDDIISKISNILKTFKINVLSITADIRSTGVMYRIVPGSGIRPAAIANLHREIAFALGVCEAIVIEYSDGTVALTLKDYDSPVERIWKVGDYYNVDGKEGVVFWVDESGKHGKIVSLDEAKLQWCTYDESEKKLTSIAVHRQNGMINLQSIMELTDWKSKYPAFAWCADRGTGWYLPAKEELEILFADKNVYSQVNKGLELKGKMLEPLGRGTAYWSSTEKNSHSAFGYSLNNYCASGVCREKFYYVRAVYPF